MNSLGHKEHIKTRLEEIIQDIDNVYNNIWIEINNEINIRKDLRESLENETKEIYDKLNIEICSKILKNKLPLRVKLLNKIECCGYGIQDSQTVRIRFQLNNKDQLSYYIKTSELKELLEKL